MLYNKVILRILMPLGGNKIYGILNLKVTCFWHTMKLKVHDCH